MPNRTLPVTRKNYQEICEACKGSDGVYYLDAVAKMVETEFGLSTKDAKHVVRVWDRRTVAGPWLARKRR
jgi:hypothetical protein